MVETRKKIEEMESQESVEKPGFMDIKFFVGLVLIICGTILVLAGLFYPTISIKEKINVNLIWGLIVLGVGLAFYLPSKKPSQWSK